MTANPHAESVADLAAIFHTSLSAGLSLDQVDKHREIYGENVIPEEPSTPLWQLILEQFKDQLVLILLGSAGVSFVLAYFEEGNDKATAYVEPIVILLILIANAIVGVVQESNAEKAIEVSPAVPHCSRAAAGRSPRVSHLRPTRLAS